MILFIEDDKNDILTYLYSENICDMCRNDELSWLFTNN